MNWTEKHIKGLLSTGKIRGYKMPEKKKGYSKDGAVIPRDKPKGIVWLEWNLAYFCNLHSLELKTEYQFDPARKYRFDFAISPNGLKIALEYEGGLFMKRGGHNSPAGIHRDIEKYERAQALGWKIIRVTCKTYTTALKSLDQLIK
jgi:hypothetical protein